MATDSSILTSIKKLLGIEEDYTEFDSDIIIHINAAFMALYDIGVGPENGFTISDKTATWIMFFGEVVNLEDVKTYIYLKVRLIFDPPSTSAVLEAFNREIQKIEWRLMVRVDPPIISV